jgi:hypothetical protein
VIDFDRAILANPGNERLARQGCDRFWRSMAKLSAALGISLAPQQREWVERRTLAEAGLRGASLTQILEPAANLPFVGPLFDVRPIETGKAHQAFGVDAVPGPEARGA